MCKTNGIDHHLFILHTLYADSCTSCTVNNDDIDMDDVEKIDKIVDKIGGNKIKATKTCKKSVISAN